MGMTSGPQYVAFAAQRAIAEGDLLTVAKAVRAVRPKAHVTILIFDRTTGQQIDIDLRGTDADLVQRYTPADSDENPREIGTRRRGRPRLGVVGREVTLLPRHWQWLDEQRGGASATLRRLVDQARHSRRDADLVRASQDRANRFMSAMAGNLPGFEEATRALYARNRSKFLEETKRWPRDVRLTARAFAADTF